MKKNVELKALFDLPEGQEFLWEDTLYKVVSKAPNSPANTMCVTQTGRSVIFNSITIVGVSHDQ